MTLPCDEEDENSSKNSLTVMSGSLVSADVAMTRLDLTCPLQREDGPSNLLKLQDTALSPPVLCGDPFTDLVAVLLYHITYVLQAPRVRKLSASSALRNVQDTETSSHAPADVSISTAVDRARISSVMSPSVVLPQLPFDGQDVGKDPRAGNKESTTSASDNDDEIGTLERNVKISLNRVFHCKSEPFLFFTLIQR